MSKLNVAMIGYQFMGRAHSNAWRQVGRFFDLPLQPVLHTIARETGGLCFVGRPRPGGGLRVLGLGEGA